MLSFLNPARDMGPTVTESLLMDVAEHEERQRLVRYKRAWQAYAGDWKRPLKVKVGEADDNVIVNKAEVVVDKGVSFLFGKPLTFQLDETTTTPQEEYLDGVWDANRRASLLLRMGLNGGVFGHVFVKIAQNADGSPRLILLDPANVLPTWDSEDIDRVLHYRIQWNALDPKTGRPMVRRQVIEDDGGRWTITDEVARQPSMRWEQLSTAVWPWSWPPIVHCQNLPSPNEFWGKSDIEDHVLGLNAARNFGLSNIARILKWHASPKTWARGVGAGGLNVDVDQVILLASEKAELHNLEMQSDLASSLEYDRRVDEALHEVTRVPAVATGKLENIGQLSGLALMVLYQPLVEKTLTKRVTYGEMLTELNRRLLDMGGHGEDLRPKNVWPELLPQDPSEERTVLLLDQQLGVASKQTIADKLGYDWETEQQRLDEEGAAAVDKAQTLFDRGQLPPGEQATNMPTNMPSRQQPPAKG